MRLDEPPPRSTDWNDDIEAHSYTFVWPGVAAAEPGRYTFRMSTTNLDGTATLYADVAFDVAGPAEESPLVGAPGLAFVLLGLVALARRR